mmetsp:Transcript_11828/g.27392  ORF Transcript_11828/g.27392 Transcript_11828/m.27392 type:complete len:92 (-) Transcript_11828:389-664(-)
MQLTMSWRKEGGHNVTQASPSRTHGDTHYLMVYRWMGPFLVFISPNIFSFLGRANKLHERYRERKKGMSVESIAQWLRESRRRKKSDRGHK